MKLVIDTETKTLTCDGKNFDLYSDQSFETLSDLWLKVGWNQKYSYTFSWLGFPIIQLPEDMIRYQEVIFQLKPDVIIETGIAHGGSAIFVASLCKMMGHGRVVAIDIDIKPANRERIEANELSSLITLIEGSSTSPEVVSKVQESIRPDDVVLVVLDSDHSYDHVLAELNAYAPLVTPNSYIVATDGIMKDLTDVPRGNEGWVDDHPTRAAQTFAAENPVFIVETPAWPFNESTLDKNITHWPGAWIKRLS